MSGGYEAVARKPINSASIQAFSVPVVEPESRREKECEITDADMWIDQENDRKSHSLSLLSKSQTPDLLDRPTVSHQQVFR